MKRLIPFLCVFFFLFTSQANAFIKEGQIENYQALDTHIQKLNRTVPGSRILLVFDLDNTLLSIPSDFGSEGWFNWQARLLKEDPNSPYLVTHDENSLWKGINVIVKQISHMELTDKHYPDYLESWQKKGMHTLILTARGPDLDFPSTRELKRNHLDFAKGAPKDNGRFVQSSQRYHDGVILANNQNKGKTLETFLKQWKIKPQVIIFVDDAKYNIDAMKQSFQNSPIQTYVYRFSGEDAKIAAFEKSDKKAVDKKWRYFIKKMRKLFPDLAI